MSIDLIDAFVVGLAIVAAYAVANLFIMKKRIIYRKGEDRPYCVQRAMLWPFIWTDCFVSISPYTDIDCRYETREEAEDAMKRLVP